MAEIHEEALSHVYIKIDRENRILQCEGEYTLSNITDFTEWILIEAGPSCDRLNLAQSHYFTGGLYTEDGICRYVWSNNKYRLRTEQEMDADRIAQSIRRADRDYDPGEYMTLDGVLYKVVLPILSGTQITPGTNVEATTIEAEMAILNKEEN